MITDAFKAWTCSYCNTINSVNYSLHNKKNKEYQCKQCKKVSEVRDLDEEGNKIIRKACVELLEAAVNRSSSK